MLIGTCVLKQRQQLLNLNQNSKHKNSNLKTQLPILNLYLLVDLQPISTYVNGDINLEVVISLY